jgi:putative endonuclease
LACDFLSNSGYTVLTRNFCNSKAEEIDIVAFDYQNLELVFLEVKTRKNFYFGSPSTTITQRKLKKMTNLAQRYLDKYPLPHDFRFDLIAIATETDEIDHYQSISWLSGKQ